MPIFSTGENIGKVTVTVLADGDRLDESIRENLDGLDGEFEKAGERHGKKYGDGFDRENDRTFAHLIDKLDAVSDATGRAFGKGSRNDFVNFIGAITGGITKLAVTGPLRLLGGIADYGRKLRGIFGETGVIGVFTQVGADASKALFGLTSAVAGLTFVIGPAISLFSTLGGVLTALAATVSSGLIGGLGALTGALLPAGAGLTAFILAIKGLKSTDAGTAVLTRLKDQFNALGATIAKSMDLRGIFARLGDGLKSATPLLSAVGRQVGKSLTGFLDIFSQPAGRKFVDMLEHNLPRQVGLVGQAFNNAFSGLLGLLRGLQPITDRFLHWLVNITSDFDHFANSAKGQNEIVRFFDDAGDSAARLGDFLGAVFDFLGVLITRGNEAGDTLFGDMTRAINGWTSTLEKNPAILDKWFSDAVKVGRAIGNVAVGIAKIFDVLDNEVSRQIATGALNVLADVLKTTATVLRPLIDLMGAFNPKMQSFVGFVAAAAFVFPKLNSALQASGTSFSGWVGNVRNAETRMKALSSAARGLAGVGGLAVLASTAQSSSKAVRVLGGALGGALAGFGVGGGIGAAIGAVIGGLTGLIHKSDDASSSVDQLTASLNKQTGALTANSREIIAHNLEQDGILEKARAAGLSLETVTKAAQGNGPALRELSAAWGVLDEKQSKANGPQQAAQIEEQKKRIEDVIAAVREQAGAVEDARASQARLSQAMGKTREVSDKVVGSLKGFPKRLVTQIDTLGIPTSLRGIRNLTREYRLQPKQVTTLMKIAGVDVTRRQLRLSKVDIKGIPAKAETKLLLQNYAPTKRQINDLQKQYKLTDKQVQTIVKQLGGEKVLARLREVQQEADKTDKKKPTPKLDLLDGLFNGKWKAADSKMNDIGRNHKSATIDANTSPFFAGWNNVLGALSRNVNKSITITTHYVQTGKPATARGGLFSFPQERLIAEAGREAVVPLDRPLSQIDPSVRWLAALAQGRSSGQAVAVGGGGGRSVTIEQMTVVSPSTDTRAVARQVVDQLAVVGY